MSEPTATVECDVLPDATMIEDRVRAYNEGLLNGMRDVREIFEHRFAEALREIEEKLSGRMAAYDLRIVEPMADIEAGARALCTFVGLDPLKPFATAGSDYVPLWTLREGEARACILAALAAPRETRP